MRALFATCLLLAAAATHAGDVSHFRANVQGELTIGPDGSVVDVRFDDANWMAPLVREGYESQVRAWRFEPILEDGKPVNALGRMSLRLSAKRDDASGRAEFRIDQAYFLDPGPDTMEKMAARAGMSRAPVYPEDPARAGVGAEVGVVLRLGADGAPEEAAVDRFEFRGASARSLEKKFASQFERATLAAAKHWRFPGFEAGQVLRVPVVYTPPRFAGPRAGWIPVVPVNRETPAWALVDAAGRNAIQLAAGGEAPSERLRLLTPLSPEG